MEDDYFCRSIRRSISSDDEELILGAPLLVLNEGYIKKRASGQIGRKLGMGSRSSLH